METKEQKAKEYADWLHKEIEEYYGRKCGPKDMSCKNGDIRVAFLDGWDAALKSQWMSVKEKQPASNELVLCRMVSNEAIVSGYIYSEGCKWRVATSPDFHFEDYGDYECDYWMPIPSFDNVLKDK